MDFFYGILYSSSALFLNSLTHELWTPSIAMIQVRPFIPIYLRSFSDHRLEDHEIYFISYPTRHRSCATLSNAIPPALYSVLYPLLHLCRDERSPVLAAADKRTVATHRPPIKLISCTRPLYDLGHFHRSDQVRGGSDCIAHHHEPVCPAVVFP